MTGRIQKRHGKLLCLKARLLGEDRNAAASLQSEVIQKGVAVVDPTELFQLSGAVEQGFGERRLACVNLREDTDG